MAQRRVTTIPPSVNFHLWQPCNMQCHYCFARFEDVRSGMLPKGHLPEAPAIEVVRLLSEHFEKITFAGGEPTLCPWLEGLIQIAHEAGCTTMLVTNGSRLTPDYLDRIKGVLDWLTLSVDSADLEVMEAMGRKLKRGAMSGQNYIDLAQESRASGIRFKMNTVVTRLNYQEDLSSFILAMKPERWKLLQVLPVGGQNDGTVGELLISERQFREFVGRHQHLAQYGVSIVPEDNKAMTGSYAMVDPAGRFFDNVGGKYRYSRPILEVGVSDAWSDIRFEMGRFRERGGYYSW